MRNKPAQTCDISNFRYYTINSSDNIYIYTKTKFYGFLRLAPTLQMESSLIRVAVTSLVKRARKFMYLTPRIKNFSFYFNFRRIPSGKSLIQIQEFFKIVRIFTFLSVVILTIYLSQSYSLLLLISIFRFTIKRVSQNVNYELALHIFYTTKHSTILIKKRKT
jgi:hypothetical protein